MSGDVQARNRRKDKKRQKREDEAAVPGVDTSKLNESERKASVQMHVHDDHDHNGGAGFCAKIIFFSLMAVLLSLVVLIVIENRGGSDLDTPLSESRFSEYLQGWVDEKREEDHHDEPVISHDDHDHDDEEEIPIVPENEPYPEERDISNADDIDDDNASQELNAEINVNDSEQEPASIEEEEEENQSNDEEANESQNISQELEEEENQQSNDENLFEDSTPFEEEKVKGDALKDQVDELYNTYNEIADMLGKDRLETNDHLEEHKIKKDDDELELNVENVVDNDEGEDLLLQKIAEDAEFAQQKQEQESSGDTVEEESKESFSQLPAEEEEGGAQSYIEELLKQQTLEENY